MGRPGDSPPTHGLTNSRVYLRQELMSSSRSSQPELECAVVRARFGRGEIGQRRVVLAVPGPDVVEYVGRRQSERPEQHTVAPGPDVSAEVLAAVQDCM